MPTVRPNRSARVASAHPDQHLPRAGVAKGTVFNHFASKEDLIAGHLL
ncbi:TetR family transcriptional regulator [Nocardia pneumoniae]|nr:TetR family transcriptional regulator [Nocardia pneumoniae]